MLDIRYCGSPRFGTFLLWIMTCTSYNNRMVEAGQPNISIAEDVMCYRERRGSLISELGRYQSGALSIGDRKVGEPVTQGTITHITYLQHAIKKLDRVIGAYAPTGD